ncbi:MAG: hypothetical protein JWQ51_488 [Tardiphaga sp.]|nr:hypothetical protein [Tardiphaga sp.]
MAVAGADIIGGALMGLAGSLHCAGLCGGIAASLLLAASPVTTQASRSTALLTTQIGRATSYTLCGALVGGGGAAFAHLLALANAQSVLRVIAAGLIVWTGCSVAGWGRGFSALDRMTMVIAAKGSTTARLHRKAHPLVMGMLWGFAPCGMVYAAMLNAMMTGSAAQGAQFMAGFGLGTIPAVATAALGVTAMAGRGLRLPERATLRRVLGVSIVALGIVSLVEPASSLAALCLGR